MSIVAYADVTLSNILFLPGGVQEATVGELGSKWVMRAMDRIPYEVSVDTGGRNAFGAVRSIVSTLVDAYMARWAPTPNESWIDPTDLAIGEQLLIANGIGKTTLTRIADDEYMVSRRSGSGYETEVFHGTFDAMWRSLRRGEGELPKWVLTRDAQEEHAHRWAVNVIIVDALGGCSDDDA